MLYILKKFSNLMHCSLYLPISMLGFRRDFWEISRNFRIIYHV